MLTQTLRHTPVLGDLLDFVFPPLCFGCGEFCEDPSGLCDTCSGRIDTYDSPMCLACFHALDSALRCPECEDEDRPLFVYGNYIDPLKEAILQLKFHGLTSPARLFGSRLAETFGERLAALNPDLLTPIPLQPARENSRGYNQAKLIAEAVARPLELPVRDDLLRRRGRRRPQSKVRLAGRHSNVRNVFESAVEADGLRVLVVDDVVTSGATMTEAVKTLEQAGAVVVGGVALAHGV